jgi:metalloendopeptidase OMA1, mitochondrial
MKTWIKGCALAISSLLLVNVFTGCATVPVTGRQQFNLLPPGQELQLGLTSFEEIRQQLTVSTDPAANEMLQRVGKRIAAVASPDLPEAQWEFVLFENDQPNAFCLPGGKVGVYTGILPITKDEAGLATVIGHEVAHAVARHGAERISRAMLGEIGGQLVGATLSGTDPRVQTLAAVGYGLGSQLAVHLPHSRTQEAEADEIGILYMARAGYNPQAALEFWTRFAEAADRAPGVPWFLRTHPVTDDRIAHLQELMPRAMQEYQASHVGFTR